MSAATFVLERQALRTVTQTLVREFHPDLPAGAVIHTVQRSRDELVHLGVRAGLAVATETMARRRLSMSRAG